MRKPRLSAAVVIACLTVVGFVASVTQAEEQKWGNFSGRFVLEGEIPKPKPILVTHDRDYFADVELVDESLVLNPMNRGIANIVVYSIDDRDSLLRIHPSYDRLVKEPVILAMNAGRFAPHVTLLQTGQTLRIVNKDQVANHAKIDLLNNPPVGPVVPSGATMKYQYDREERLPGKVSSPIYPWMNGYVLIRDNPYVAKTDINGRFEIKNLPVGKHVFQFWHEKMGYVRDMQFGDAKTDRRGRAEIAVAAGDNQLMTGKINSVKFK